jgi:hypothetical protein
MPSMFSYDPILAAAVQTTPQSIADVVRILEAIEAACADGDGLKWFNGLYLNVTQAVEARVNAAGFINPAWVAALDVRFARFYFAAIESALSDGSQGKAPGCWQAVFDRRNQTAIARIQFAMAGMNAHINHDLPQAVFDICQTTSVPPEHGTAEYNDFTALNTTLDSLTDAAKAALDVRLLGDALPAASRLEDTLAAWSMADAREAAWNNAELLWHLADAPLARAAFLNGLDGLTAVAGKAILVPVP